MAGDGVTFIEICLPNKTERRIYINVPGEKEVYDKSQKDEVHIPNITNWIEKGHNDIDYYLTEALSKHGCFRKYV